MIKSSCYPQYEIYMIMSFMKLQKQTCHSIRIEKTNRHRFLRCKDGFSGLELWQTLRSSSFSQISSHVHEVIRTQPPQDKTPSDKTPSDKTPRTKPPHFFAWVGQNPPIQIKGTNILHHISVKNIL